MKPKGPFHIIRFKVFQLFLIALLPFLLVGQSLNNGKESKMSQTNFDMDFVNTSIDSIMTAGILNKAFPGALLLVSHNDSTIFHKAYGFHTYDSIKKVELNAIYDLASVTKITGPLLALMKLYEEGHIKLDEPFSKYWKSWRHKKDKKDITLRELLAHQSGMQAYIVFLNEVMKKGRFKKRYIKTHSNNRFSKQAYSNIFVKDRFQKKMFRLIKRSEVSAEKKYLYSGIASLIYPKLIEEITGKPYEIYLDQHFYSPLECETLGFNPRTKGLHPIIPTELDTIFRKDIVHGWVHDENAALLGGISGNAGLFGTATDLNKVMQMLVNKGVYNGRRYLKASTVNEFIRIQYPENENRRGLGFDKPLIGNDTLNLNKAFPAPEVSPESFGHGGFTGTFVWADPEKKLIFIFLSNRVYPSRSHRNLYNLNIRPSLQQVFYKALEMKEEFINN